MRSMIVGAALLSLLSVPAMASAEEAIRSGLSVKTSDGARLGRVDRVNTAKDGTITSASLIYDGRIIRLPASTLKAAEKGLETSLTRKEVRDLK